MAGMWAECRMMNAECRIKMPNERAREECALPLFCIHHSAFCIPSFCIFPSDSHDRIAPRQAGAEGDEYRDVALLQPARAPRLVQRDRDAGGGGVAVAVDVDEHLVLRQPELLHGRVDDP